jgi:TonB-linked SusC/RagA family outer membrane protein
MYLKLTRYFLLLPLLLSYSMLFGQQRTVTGVVVNEDTREPLQGVTIGVKGTDKSTISNDKGEFSILVAGNESVLKFSSVGFIYQEISVGAKSAFSVSMIKDAKQMDEVVVVGYGQQKKISLTGSIVSASPKDIEDLPVTNLGAALQGRFVGVSVSGGTDRPGNNATITVRVPFTLAKDGPQGTNPLFVIDDVIRPIDKGLTDFNLLDPSEIESISILKDAAAAVYGARSNQGVVIVKTKRGKAGKIQIAVNSSIGFNEATQLPKMMNGAQLANYLNDALIESYRYGTNPQGYLTDSKYYTPDELDYFQANNYNWLGHAWQSSYYTRQALNISGGTDKATFFAGGTYTKQNGNLPNINIDKWTFRASSDVKIAEHLKVGLSLSGDLSNTNMYLLKQGGENAENDMKGLLYTPGFTPPYINDYPVKLSTSSNQNTIDAFHFFEVQRLDNYNRSRNVGLNIQANAEYQIPFIKGLSAKVQYAKILDFSFPKQFGTKYKLYSFNMKGGHNHIYGDSVIGTTTVSNGTRVYFKPEYSDYYQLNASLSYNRKFGKHEITAIAVVEQSETKLDNVQAITEDPTDGAPDDARFAFGAQTVFETESEAGSLGYIGRVNYAYSNKYLAELAFRYDASTNFPPQNRWGFFPSVSVGWVISEEDFFQRNIPFIDFMKIRASAGHMGGDNTKAYAYLQRYTPLATGGPVFGGNNPRSVGTKNEAMPNPDVHWDDDNKYNLGIDAVFLKSRLSTTVEAFYDHRYNVLTALSASVPLIVGSTIGSENYSTINDYGYEISLGWKDKINKDASYSVSGFFSWNEAKNIKVDVAKGIIGTYEDPTGESTDMGIKGFRYLGMFRSQAEVDAFVAKHPGYTVFGQVPRPGMLYYDDIRGPKNATTSEYGPPDGKVDDNDQEFIDLKSGNHYGFGFTLGGFYKGFRFEAVISGAFGGRSMVEGAARKLGTLTSSRPAFWADHWSDSNPDAAYPNPYYSSSYDVASAFWFKSSTSIRMRSANLSYTFSPKLIKAMGFSNFKIYVTSTNPFNFYNPYNYKDNANGSFDSYPILRTVAFGINATL